MSAKVIYMIGQSNCKGNAAMAGLQAQYTSANPFTTIKVWNGTNGFVSMNYTTNTNQWPELGNTFGIEFKLMTSIQSYYNDTVYIVKPAWGSHGLQNGAGTSGTYDPAVRGNTTGKYDVAASAYNEAYDALFQTYKNNIDILACILIGGEADAKNPYGTPWQAALTSFISKVRGNTGRANLPFIVTKLSSSTDGSLLTERTEVNNGTDAVVGNVSGVYAINTDSCSLNADLIHYDAAGYETLGGLIYNCMVSNNLLI